MILSKKIFKKMKISENIKEFFINNFQEKEFDVCEDGLNWLIENFPDKIFDVWDVIKKLEDEKDSDDYILWLFENFKLSGTCRSWYENGNLKFKYHYENGRWQGSCIFFNENGNLIHEDNYENGELI